MATYSRKEIKGGRLLESIALGHRRGDEDGGKRNKVKSNRYFRAGINTLLYFGKFTTNAQGGFSRFLCLQLK